MLHKCFISSTGTMTRCHGLVLVMIVLLFDAWNGSSVRIIRHTVKQGVQQPDRFVDFCNFCSKAQIRIIEAMEEEERRYLPTSLGDKIGVSSSFSHGQRGAFVKDPWEKKVANSDTLIEGEGCTCVLQRGNIWEKAGVSTTFTSGVLSKQRAEAISGRRGENEMNLVGTK